MTTAIDTNVLIALWEAEPLSGAAARALEDASVAGGLAISAPVFAELSAAPRRDSSFVAAFCRDTGVAVEWEMGEKVWRAAATGFRAYALRRRAAGGGQPRRILADFLIGAHAAANGYRLLSLDAGFYRRAFPGLRLILL